MCHSALTSETASTVVYVMEGSLRQAGTRVRIAAQLIDASSGAGLWAELIRRALDVAPSNHLAHHALASPLFSRKEFGAFRAAVERAIALNSMDGLTAAYLGLQIAFSGDWERGCFLTERATQLNFWPQHHSNPHTTRAFAMSVVKSSSLEKTAVIPKARASFSMSTL